MFTPVHEIGASYFGDNLLPVFYLGYNGSCLTMDVQKAAFVCIFKCRTMLLPDNQVPGSGDTQSGFIPVPRSIGHHVKPIFRYSHTWIFTSSGPLVFFHVVL